MQVKENISSSHHRKLLHFHSSPSSYHYYSGTCRLQHPFRGRQIVRYHRRWEHGSRTSQLVEISVLSLEVHKFAKLLPVRPSVHWDPTSGQICNYNYWMGFLRAHRHQNEQISSQFQVWTHKDSATGALNVVEITQREPRVQEKQIAICYRLPLYSPQF